MSDFIKREDAFTRLKAYIFEHGFFCDTDADKHYTAQLIDLILKSIRSADVVEIEPGAWILTDYDGNTMKIKGIQRERIEEENEVERKKGAWIPLFPILCDRPYCYECSNCGFATERRTNFCSCCGADMQRKEADT